MTRRQTVLWLTTVAGPLAWLLDLVVSWVLVPPAHRGGSAAPLWWVAAVALAIATASASTAGALLVRDRRDHFLAVGGLVLSVASVLLVLATAVPVLLLPPGAEP
jgi:hypothetical protein